MYSYLSCNFLEVTTGKVYILVFMDFYMAKPHKFEDFPHYFSSLDSIIHYTCNPPSIEILRKYGINLRGQEVDTDPAGFIEIPIEVYNSFGFTEIKDKNVLKINCETLMRKLK